MSNVTCKWCGNDPCACGVDPAVDLDIGLTPLAPFSTVPDAGIANTQPPTRRVQVPFELLKASTPLHSGPLTLGPLDLEPPDAGADLNGAQSIGLEPFDDNNGDSFLGLDPFAATDQFSMEALLGSKADALVLGDPTNIVESVRLKMRNLDIDLDDLADSDEAAPVTHIEKQLFIGADVERLLTPLIVLERRPTAADLSVLSPFERFVLEQIDGRRSMHDIQYAMGLSEGDLRIAVALLADKHLVQPAARSTATTATPKATTEVPAGVPLPVFQESPSTRPDPVALESVPAPPPPAASPKAATHQQPQPQQVTALGLILARAARAEGENDLIVAASVLREAVRLEPGSAIAHNRLGVLLARTRDLPGALQMLTRAKELRPDDPTILSNYNKIASIAERHQAEKKKPAKRR